MSKTFQELYTELNDEQRKAVDAIEGPVMVIAGPGTGKTQILTLRIANILRKTDIPPEAILAVTFTEAGVVAMRKRLAEIIGSQAYEVTITTFHGFAQSVIQKYPEAFPRIIGSINITEADQVRIMEKLLDPPAATSITKTVQILRPFGDRLHYLRDILHAIQTLKREGLSVDAFEQLVKHDADSFAHRSDLYHEKGAHKGKMKGEHKDTEKMIAKNAELASLYGAYQDVLTEEKLYDFDDMIMETLSAMKADGELLIRLQEQYQYVLVDEHQDTNNAQNRILELLMSYHPNPNLFIVGDEKQAIFRFQGASLENFHYFKNKYEEALLITLKDNYRSTQSILDAVLTKLIASGKHSEKKIQLIEAESTDSELYIVGKLISHDENNAVLYRDNRDVLPLARMFDKLGIPYHIESDLDIMTDPDIRKLVMIFRAINYLPAREHLEPVLYLDLWGIPAYEAKQFTPELIKKLSSWKTAAHNKTLLEFFDLVVDQSGLLKSILSRPDAVEGVEKLSIFLEQLRRLLEVKPLASLDDFISHLDRMDRHRLSIRGALTGSQSGKVRFMTAHRSKGLEFDRVFIINAYDGHWGNRRHVEKLKLLPQVFGVAETSDTDERNLFYVALTRARKEVTISYAKLSLDQREQLPSQFIGELKQELLEKTDTHEIEMDFKRHREILFAPSKHAGATDVRNMEYIRDLFKKRGFAVTHLNNYLECPWKYFFINLLRIPKSPEGPQMFGIAIHAALSDTLNQKNRSISYLLARFEKHLAEQPMNEHDREDYLKKGQDILRKYHASHEESWNNPILTEFKISGVELTPEILLTGNIDKIEILNSHNEVVVTDYKTGKAKSRNEITGNTRSADGSYYRQLVFYNLLLNRFKEGYYRMKIGEIDFVEHAKSERFEIPSSDIASLEAQIKTVADEILNLTFWNNTCDKRDCEWCGLRSLMHQ